MEFSFSKILGAHFNAEKVRALEDFGRDFGGYSIVSSPRFDLYCSMAFVYSFVVVVLSVQKNASAFLQLG